MSNKYGQGAVSLHRERRPRVCRIDLRSSLLPLDKVSKLPLCSLNRSLEAEKVERISLIHDESARFSDVMVRKNGKDFVVSKQLPTFALLNKVRSIDG